MLDIPCGHFTWINTIASTLDTYIGADINKEIISHNNQSTTSNNVHFVLLDILEDMLPKVDLILCRDFFTQLSPADVTKALINIKKSGAKYILMTTYQQVTSNEEQDDDAWRPYNLQLPPFNLPKPLGLFDEYSFNERDENYGKCLGFWQLKDISF